MTYCHWLNEFLIGELPEGRVLRLPTEAEWEKAARGTDGRNYPWGNSYNEDNTNCRKGRKPPYGINTTPVGAYSPGGDSPYGCGDMIGNVSEWTHSLFKPYPYRIEDGRESEDVIGDKPRVLRGGSWYDNHFDVTSRYYRHPPNYTWDRNGFRVVLAPKFQF
jgi:formylglycine-generating enzyme required for sulfatase activity